MKLNLLPTYVSREKQLRSAIVISALIALLSVGAAVGMIITSQNELQAKKEQARAVEPRAQQVVAISKQPAVILTNAQGIIRNINLADAMNAHNAKFPDLYDEVRAYIPSFYRIWNINAQPSGADSVVVTMTGALRSYQQYADLMLALMRIDGAVSVSRSGYQIVDPYVPQLTPEDQAGKPIRPGEQPIPDDPLERLQYFIARGQSTGFMNVGNYGTADPTLVRGAMPDYSTVTVSVILQGPRRNLQPPDPISTLSTPLAGGAPAPGGGAPPGGGGPPRVPGAGRGNMIGDDLER